MENPNTVIVPVLEETDSKISEILKIRNLKSYQLCPRLEAERRLTNGQKLGQGFRVFWDNKRARVDISADKNGYVHFSTTGTFGSYFSISWNLGFEFIELLRGNDIVSVGLEDYKIAPRSIKNNICMAYLNVERGQQSDRLSEKVEFLGGQYIASFSINDRFELWAHAHTSWVDVIFSGLSLKKISIKNPLLFSQSDIVI